MLNKNRSSPNSKWSPVLGVIQTLFYYSIIEITWHHIFLNIFGPVKGLLCAILFTSLIAYIIESKKEMAILFQRDSSRSCSYE